MYKITAKNKKYNGQTGDCYFVNGVGETDNEKLIAYFKSAGYTVEEIKKSVPEKPLTKKEQEALAKAEAEKAAAEQAAIEQAKAETPPNNSGDN